MNQKIKQLYNKAIMAMRKNGDFITFSRNISGIAIGMYLVIPFANPLNMVQKLNEVMSNKIALTQVFDDQSQFPNTYPESKIVPRKVMTIPVTAYNSLPGQTDGTPCFTANGYDLCKANQENVIAANFLPFGTKVKFPDLYGDKIFTVQDRMNARYSYHADVWLKSYAEANKFGLKRTKIEIY